MVKINITTYHPDTCYCVIQYSWDGDVPVEQRIHTPHATIKDCPEHSGLTVKELHDIILDENQRKNKFYGELIKLDSVGEDIIQDDGSTVRQLKKGIRYDWQFDIDRNLEVMVLGATLTTKEKGDLQIISDSKLGLHKVKVL